MLSVYALDIHFFFPFTHFTGQPKACLLIYEEIIQKNVEIPMSVINLNSAHKLPLKVKECSLEKSN